jgi:hypothetical protein
MKHKINNVTGRCIKLPMLQGFSLVYLKSKTGSLKFELEGIVGITKSLGYESYLLKLRE